ncbi:NitT/TauT family transport system substrate-binding protein [Faunimonas pinastri]|uniref:NitT/TauT family transport system substrate-binding protein n=2 Tax=Faunimonas pinastri TaxID=1855383 RepID=A0A1H9B7D8_9HYPH|nr:NitT/TauT family transport system substrate-binding protein [Faunimonas pinastri]
MLGAGSRAMAADARVLKINTLASASAVNVPLQSALRSGLGEIAGFAPAEMRPTAKIPQIAQEVIAGAADMGDADIASTLAAAEAGADLKIIGLSYNNTDQVIVSNADKTKSLADIADRGGTIAVNSIGDFMYVMVLGALAKQGIDPQKVNFIEMGSSGDRARALLAGRVDAVPMHIEQAEQIKARGNYQVLVTPWKEYDDWFSAVIMATSGWLKADENKKAAVAVLKASLTAFRKTDSDYAWYKTQVGKYASSKDLKAADDTLLKPVWQQLTGEIKAFSDMEQLNPDAFAKIMPVYKQAGALKGTLDLGKVIDRTYLEQALKELA